jgi:hypothetical protein
VYYKFISDVMHTMTVLRHAMQLTVGTLVSVRTARHWISCDF